MFIKPVMAAKAASHAFYSIARKIEKLNHAAETPQSQHPKVFLLLFFQKKKRLLASHAPTNSRPIKNRLISFVPAPISYNFASLKNRSTGKPFKYPAPPNA